MIVWIVREQLPNGDSVSIVLDNEEQAGAQASYFRNTPCGNFPGGHDWEKVRDDGDNVIWHRTERQDGKWGTHVVEMCATQVYHNYQEV